MKFMIQATCLFSILSSLSLPLGVEGKKKDGQTKKGKNSKQEDTSSSDSPSYDYDYDANCNEDDVILAWNRIALEANVRDHNGFDKNGNEFTETMGPPASAVQLAKVHLAMFDAHNSIAKEYNPAVVMVDDPSYTVGASINAAVATAAYQSLVMSYPLQAEYFMTPWEDWLDGVSDETAKRKGMQVGAMVASSVIVKRMGDGTDPGSEQFYDFGGLHELDPIHPNQGVISPQAGKITPFFMEEPLVAPQPPDLNSDAYTEAYMQVKALGGDNITTSTTRNVMESVIGWYWSYNASPQLGTPPRLCNEIARTVACQMGNTVSQNARLFAMVNGGLSDAGVSAWATKFEFNYWRPIVGIRNGHEDGNPYTVRDEHWKYFGASRSNPLASSETSFTPPFPAYTSGHATFCGVTFKILANFYGTNNIPVEFRSQEFDGETQDDAYLTRPCLVQKFHTLSQMTAQCAASRVFNGVHWKFDGSEGAKVGESIADYIFENSMMPLAGPAPTKIVADGLTVEEEIDAMLARAVTPEMESCEDEDDSILEILDDYFAEYREAKLSS